ncbi:tRNA epoxyqueuosine(34) reductase QueG [Enterovirga sp.]|uniref:tRNA epoxyqueuosine(34) reductase QueG n=1 Tax=Enterovirga sp. TaxID=2026350 RepID=UPI00262AE80B|nr:tRNA epoxyqueuosine(34) reductase QueG [Enterovirga sp.]
MAERAAALGFDLLGTTTPDAIPEAAGRLSAWLADGHHGSMSWMEADPGRRADPRGLWPEVRSVVMLGLSTAPPTNPLLGLAQRERGLLATYAVRRDYHEVIKGRLKEIASLLASRSGAEVKVFVDTAPVMEKPLAAAAGLGWTGKHSVVVSRRHGSWLLLGAIFTTAELPPDPPERERCGSCTRCLDICPTGAFAGPYRLDARRCIAYLTIEHAGHIPAEFRAAIGNRVFGCDDCLAVCPWNSFAAASSDARLAMREELAAPALRDLAGLDDSAFRRLFAGTPIKRTGRDRVVRNTLIAIGNSGEPTLSDAAERLLRDPSPLVRAMAVWALARLRPDYAASLAGARLGEERDEAVRAEWRAAGKPPSPAPIAVPAPPAG